MRLDTSMTIYVPYPDTGDVLEVQLGNWITRTYGVSFTDKAEALKWLLSQVRSKGDDLRRAADMMEKRVLDQMEVHGG